LINGEITKAINFDNAATTPPFVSVVEEINNFSKWYSSIHRGTGFKSQASSKFYDNSREKIADFVHADLEKDVVIYTKNTTESINMLSNILSKNKMNNKNVILSTDMEHHSNDLPWREKFVVDYISIDIDGRLRLDDLNAKFKKYKGKVLLVTVTGASNVTGYKNPIHEIAKIAHENDAEILVDGAQLAPHGKIHMGSHDSIHHIDYLAFSAHKMYAPFGIGVLIGPKKIFNDNSPDFQGGGTIELVTHDYIKWADTPDKNEAGTPNIMGVVALVESIKTLENIGMNYLEKYESNLVEYALSQMKRIPGIKFYINPVNNVDRVSIIPFNMEGINHLLLANILSKEAGIAVRNGCFCAQPYVQRLLNISLEEMEMRKKEPKSSHPGMVRLSFGLYNTYNEIDILVKTLSYITHNKKAYIDKYGSL